MKVLPMMQPWASLVVLDVKRTETRDRHTKHRGALLVLATRTVVEYDHAPAAWDALAAALGAGDARHIDPSMVPRGKLVGGVHVVDSIKATDVAWDGSDDVRGWIGAAPFYRLHPDQKPLGHFAVGRRVWLLADAVKFEQPIVCRAMPGMFDAPPDVEREAVWQWKQERNDMTERDLLQRWS